MPDLLLLLNSETEYGLPNIKNIDFLLFNLSLEYPFLLLCHAFALNLLRLFFNGDFVGINPVRPFVAYGLDFAHRIENFYLFAIGKPAVFVTHNPTVTVALKARFARSDLR